MIAFYTREGVLEHVKVYEDYSVTHKSDGCDKMQFYVDTSLDQYPSIYEEASVITDDNLWIIKKIDDDRIDCELDFDFLKRTVHSAYNSGSKTLASHLEGLLPEGWTVVGADVSSISRTITFDYCTDFDIAYACMSTFGVRFSWKIREKRLYVYNLDTIQPSGEYLSSELNLKGISYKGETTDFATRLYPFGKDGMGIEEAIVEGDLLDLLNSRGYSFSSGDEYGLPYVENRAYADKTVCTFWNDERYTVPESMLEDAIDKLDEISQPCVSYECKIVDLAKQNPEYAHLEFAMYKKIILIDSQRKLRVEHQIVEYTEYPDEPNRNKVTLSTVPETVTSKVSKVSSRIDDEIEKAKTDFESRMMFATGLLLNAFGGHVLITEEPNAEIFIMDDPDPEEAEVVWRFNVNGIGKSSTGIEGPYTTSLTVNDEFITSTINAMIIRGARIEADSITADKISTSYTDRERTYSTEIAADAVNSRFEELINSAGEGIIDVIQKTLTELKASADGIEAKFSTLTSGGTNYVKNSSGLNGVSDDWQTASVDNQSTPVVTTEDDGDTASGCCFRLSEDTILYQTVKGLLPDKDYSLSFKVRKTSTQNSQVVIVYGKDENDDVIQDVVYTSSVISEGWERVELVLDPSVRGSEVQIRFITDDDYFYVADVMLSEGNIIKAWEPAPNEIYTQGVKIDEKGIEVYRSDTSEKTVINNTEFAGYYGNEKVFSINKDETHIQKTVVEGELIIGQGRCIPYSKGGEKGISITIIA